MMGIASHHRKLASAIRSDGQTDGTSASDRHNAPVSHRTLLDLLLPSVCPLCTLASGPGLCSPCRDELPELVRPCRWCGMPQTPTASDVACAHCADDGMPFLVQVTARWAYVERMVHLIGNAKAAGRPAAVKTCAGLMPVLDVDGPAVIVPVPPSPGRRTGPHLGTALARSVARQTGQPYACLLATTRLATEQHRLGAAARARNVEGLFIAVGTVPENVVLVDDLLTSGATASAAAKALRLAGAQRVELVVLARTLKYS